MQSSIRDITDALITLCEDREEDGQTSMLTNSQIVHTVVDIFGAGKRSHWPTEPFRGVTSHLCHQVSVQACHLIAFLIHFIYLRFYFSSVIYVVWSKLRCVRNLTHNCTLFSLPFFRLGLFSPHEMLHGHNACIKGLQ